MCKKPDASILKWIQCDRCQFWFHLICVGLSRDKDYEDTFFACNKCWDPRDAVTLLDEHGDPSVSEMATLDVEESDGEHSNINENFCT